MDKLHTATFIGHRKCFGISEDTVRQEIIKLTESTVYKGLHRVGI